MLILLYAITAASSALTPSQGNAAACEDTPLNVTVIGILAKTNGTVESAGVGCTIIQKSISWKQPFVIMVILPPPDSSAGVPSITSLPSELLTASKAALIPAKKRGERN